MCDATTERELFDFSEALSLAKEGWVIGNEAWGEDKSFSRVKGHRWSGSYKDHLVVDESGYGVYPWTPDQYDLFSEEYYKVLYSTEE